MKSLEPRLIRSFFFARSLRRPPERQDPRRQEIKIKPGDGRGRWVALMSLNHTHIYLAPHKPHPSPLKKCVAKKQKARCARAKKMDALRTFTCHVCQDIHAFMILKKITDAEWYARANQPDHSPTTHTHTEKRTQQPGKPAQQKHTRNTPQTRPTQK